MSVAPGAVFPNGYRTVNDERSFEQKLLDLQNECFRRFEVMATAHADTIAALKAEHTSAIATMKADHAKSIAQITAQQQADRRAHERALCELRRMSCEERRRSDGFRRDFTALTTAIGEIFASTLPRASASAFVCLRQPAIALP